MPFLEVLKKKGGKFWTSILYSLMEVMKLFDINKTWPKYIPY